MNTIKQLLATATEQLAASSDTAQLDSELLLANVLEKNRTYLVTWPEKSPTSEQLELFGQLLQRRLQGEPIAYILGQQGFWTLDLKTLPHTLIPRPDTETLVEWVLDLAAEQQLPEKSRVIDLGTGTGAIILAIASEFPSWACQGCDLITEAVELAKENAQLNNLQQVEFFQSSWFEKVAGKFDLIVSNPPYIDPDDEHLSQGDVRFEPESALTSANKGLADLETIIAQAPDFLNAGGWLLVEHGYDQQQAVQALFQLRGFSRVATRKDLGGNPRITGGQFLSTNDE